jgi:predicted nucleic acid-binding protein
MPNYLLDTSILAAYLFGRPGAVKLVSQWIARGEAATSILVYGEVMEYIRARPNFAQLRYQLRQLLINVRPYFLTYAVMERYGDVRQQLRRSGWGLIGDIDTTRSSPRVRWNAA